MTTYKIRERTRINASPKAGQDQSWTEHQVVLGRKIISRWDLREQAERAIKRLEDGEE